MKSLIFAFLFCLALQSAVGHFDVDGSEKKEAVVKVPVVPGAFPSYYYPYNYYPYPSTYYKPVSSYAYSYGTHYYPAAGVAGVPVNYKTYVAPTYQYVP